MDLVQDKRLEQIALKIMSENPDAMVLFRPEMFSTLQHVLIYDRVAKAYEEGIKLDKNLLISYLSTDEKFSDFGVNLVDKIFDLEYEDQFIDEYARKLNKLATLRRSQINLYTLAENIRGLGIPELVGKIDEVRQEVFKDANISDEDNTLDTLMEEELKYLFAGPRDGQYVETGFKDFDTLIGGFEAGDLVIIAARPSMGKCLGKGTKVVMYNGSLKSVENIKIGDQLMGDDSLPRNVLSTTTGKEMMYWVRQSHGIDYRVNESHILSLKRSRDSKKVPKGTVLDIELKDYLKKSDKFKSNYKGYKIGVEFLHTNVPIDPYFFGLWLGDGTSSNSMITSQDLEIVKFLEEYAKSLDSHVSVSISGDRCPSYRITGGRTKEARDNSLQAKLRALDVLENKHIPNLYLTNSKDIRLQLLAGLIDSDGYVNKGHGGTIEITSKYKSLAEQIKFLCDSLGYRTSIREKTAVITDRNFSTVVWRVRFNGNVSEIPTRIERKKCRVWSDYRDWTVTGVTLEQDKVDNYYGFEIDGNRRFLLEDFTVTHNTSLMLRWVLNMAKRGIPSEIYSYEMSNSQIVRRLLSMESGVPTNRLQKGQLSDEEIEQLKFIIAQLRPIPLKFRYSIGQEIVDLSNHIRLSSKLNGTKVFAVDYAQLMNLTPGRETQDLNRIARSLKNLAVELGLVIILISQLNRAVELRKNKHPMLSDLRQAGGLEESSDKVLFIYRNYYYTKSDEDLGMGELMLSKNRNGPIADFNVMFREETTNFWV